MLDELLEAVVADPQAEPRWLVLADWLEEHDDPRRAELLRLHRRLLGTCCEPERAVWQARIVELLCEGVKPCVPEKTVLVGKRPKIPMTFSFVPPGSFLMGSPESEEGRNEDETLHRVTLSRGFWMGVFPVTWAQWKRVMKTKPSRWKGENHPVDGVSWGGCHEFCRKAGVALRLPTEAEWEYSCRAGSTTPFSFGELANFGQRQRGDPTPVDRYPPNAWGLFFVQGKAREWCSDWYGPYGSGAVVDPHGLQQGTDRVQRCGCCRSAIRLGYSPFFSLGTFGFRVVLDLE